MEGYVGTVRTYNTPLSSIIIFERISGEKFKINISYDDVNETGIQVIGVEGYLRR